MTQTEKILRYIQENGSITPLDALREFSCMRLASRVSELKKAGHPVCKTMETARNKYGDPVRYARYTLE